MYLKARDYYFKSIQAYVPLTGPMDDCVYQWACKTVAITLHYSLTALFCWMLVEGIHIYVLLVKVFKRGSHLKKYCAIGWGKRTEGIKLCSPTSCAWHNESCVHLPIFMID